MKRRMLMAAACLVVMPTMALLAGCSSYKPPITTAPVVSVRVIGKDAEATDGRARLDFTGFTGVSLLSNRA